MKATPDMIERVSAAILRADGHVLISGYIDDFGRAHLKRIARAALEAMREPEPYMAEAAYDKAGVPILDFRAGWHAAIDAALATQNTEEK